MHKFKTDKYFRGFVLRRDKQSCFIWLDVGFCMIFTALILKDSWSETNKDSVTANKSKLHFKYFDIDAPLYLKQTWQICGTNVKKYPVQTTEISSIT